MKNCEDLYISELLVELAGGGGGEVGLWTSSSVTASRRSTAARKGLAGGHVKAMDISA